MKGKNDEEHSEMSTPWMLATRHLAVFLLLQWHPPSDFHKFEAPLPRAGNVGPLEAR